MVTISNIRRVSKDLKFLVDLVGLAEDDKPTTIRNGIADNGSTFIEIDTGKLYLYDLENEEWKEI